MSGESTKPKTLRIGVIGPAGFTGSYLCTELINRGHHVTGLSRNPSKIGVHKLYETRIADVSKQSIKELSAAFQDLDVIINAYGPHSEGPAALKYSKPITSSTLEEVECLVVNDL